MNYVKHDAVRFNSATGDLDRMDDRKPEVSSTNDNKHPTNPLWNRSDWLKNMLPHKPELGNKVNTEFSAATAGLVDEKFREGSTEKFSSLVDVGE